MERLRVTVTVVSMDRVGDVVSLIESLGGRVVAVGRYAPYVVADVPPGAVERLLRSPLVVRVEKEAGYEIQVLQEPRPLAPPRPW